MKFTAFKVFHAEDQLGGQYQSPEIVFSTNSLPKAIRRLESLEGFSLVAYTDEGEAWGFSGRGTDWAEFVGGPEFQALRIQF